MPITWFLIVSGVAIIVWRFIVHDRNNSRKHNNKTKNNS